VRFSKPGTYVLQLTVTTASGPALGQRDRHAEGVDGLHAERRHARDLRQQLDRERREQRLLALVAEAHDRGRKVAPALGLPGLAPAQVRRPLGRELQLGLGALRTLGERAHAPLLYGTGARPLVRTANRDSLNIWGNGDGNNLAIVGIHFLAEPLQRLERTPRCIAVYGAVQNLLIEDCYLQAGEVNLVVQGASTLPALPDGTRTS
jgi:hypothetical protein